MSIPADSEGYVVSRDKGDLYWFLDTLMEVKAGAKQTGGAYTLIEWSANAGFGPPPHIHRIENESFYVMSGALRVAARMSGTPAPARLSFYQRGWSIPLRWRSPSGRCSLRLLPDSRTSSARSACRQPRQLCRSRRSLMVLSWSRQRAGTASKYCCRCKKRLHQESAPGAGPALLLTAIYSGTTMCYGCVMSPVIV